MDKRIEAAIKDASPARAVAILTCYANSLEAAGHDVACAHKAGAEWLDRHGLAVQRACDEARPAVCTIRIIVDTDNDIGNPAEDDCAWKVASFSRRHTAYQDPGRWFEPDGQPANVGIRRKLDAGTAFRLAYYEHGLCRWSLSGEGPRCNFDTVDCAGVVYYDGDPKDLPAGYEAREKDARAFLERYTDWCNGAGIGYCIELIDDLNDVIVSESCWGFYDSDADYMCGEIASSVLALTKEHPAAIVDYGGELGRDFQHKIGDAMMAAECAELPADM